MKNKLSLKNIAKVSILAALGAILMLIKIPLFFAPNFISLDLAEIPSLLASFSMGPILGFVTVVLKNLINIIINGSDTFFVGELSNIIVNGTFVIVAGIIYKHKKTFSNAIFSLVIATILMTLVATTSNYFFIFPFYAKLYGAPLSYFVEATHAINPLVNSYLDLMIFAIVPFNLIKGTIISILTCLIYKHVSPILKK